MEENIFDKVSADIKAAMLSRDKVALEALRGIKKELLEAKTAKGSTGELSEEQVVKIVQKMVKQRKESAEIFHSQGRQDLAANELAEVLVIEKYLPPQLSDEDLEQIIVKIVSDLGAKGIPDLGKVMGVASKQLAGKAEGKIISEKVKSILSNM